MAPLTVYSNNTCPNCDNLKKALKIKGVPYEEINLHEKPEYAIDLQNRGMRQLPVMNDNGNWMTGFTPTNLMKILKARAPLAAAA
jgi:glutaredoxin 3